MLHNPISNKTVNVQIKSRSTLDELKTFIDNCNQQDREGYFVVHNDTEELKKLSNKESAITLWGREKISQLCVKLGLVDWLINRVR